jgi:membrane protease YdiL (CAAX protease family)
MAFAGGLLAILALRAHWIPGVVANYVLHAWLAAIALIWFFLLRRRFPIGSLTRRMRPWYIVALLLVAVSVGETIASPPSRGMHLPGLPTLVAQLVAAAFVVGPTEELLFRGVIQTGLNARLKRGTVVASALFGLFHLINLGYQSIGTTLLQVFTAFVLGLVFGVLYDRTRNLVGASLAHSAADLSATAVPLIAYLIR